MNLTQSLAEVEQRRQQILDQLCKRIEELPDNPRIQRLSSQSFVISSKDLGTNFSPEHHNFKRCYKRIVEHLRKSTNFAVQLKGIIDHKRLIVSKQFTITLHADVVAYLDKIYRGDNDSL